MEYIRGLYRYPNKMLGRKLPSDFVNYTDILVFAAHPDDDVLGLGTILSRHSQYGDNIKVVFVTNGTGRGGESWYSRFGISKEKAKVRYREAVVALSQINISEENILCLGFPDGGTQRYLKKMYRDISRLIHKLNPGKVYVHCIEGGHIDHDLTSFVVKSICKKMNYYNVFEWTEYHPTQPLGTCNVKFLTSKFNEFKQVKIDITDEERTLKKKMLACRNSQDVEKYFFHGEAIRQANISQLEMELYEHCQIPRTKLQPIVKKFFKHTIIYYLCSKSFSPEIVGLL